MSNDLLAQAREFVATKLFTDGCGDKARRLVFEYDHEPKPVNGKTGWSAPPIADRVADFAEQHAEQVASQRVRKREKEIALKVQAIFALGFQSPDGTISAERVADALKRVDKLVKQLEDGKGQGE